MNTLKDAFGGELEHGVWESGDLTLYCIDVLENAIGGALLTSSMARALAADLLKFADEQEIDARDD